MLSINFQPLSAVALSPLGTGSLDEADLETLITALLRQVRRDRRRMLVPSYSTLLRDCGLSAVTQGQLNALLARTQARRGDSAVSSRLRPGNGAQVGRSAGASRTQAEDDTIRLAEVEELPPGAEAVRAAFVIAMPIPPEARSAQSNLGHDHDGEPPLLTDFVIGTAYLRL
jgi:hypothetical protein